DSLKRWLTVIPDADGTTPLNWIRSGTNAPLPTDCDATVVDYRDPCNYKDEIGLDNKKEWAKILGGGIAPHALVGWQSSFMPLAYYNFSGPASARKMAGIQFLPSVDIVITSDKSKWTRCPVIELGREPALNMNGGEPGAMRNSLSVDKNGNPDGTGTKGM